MKSNLDKYQPPIRTKATHISELHDRVLFLYHIEMLRLSIARGSIVDPDYAAVCRAAVDAHDHMQAILFGGKQ